MAVIKGYIKSAGLSRIYQHTQERYCGTISAFRQYRQEFVEMSDAEKESVNAEDYLIPHKENMKRHRMLGGILRAKGINTIEIEGVYKEAYMPKAEIEISYFCFADGDFIRDILIDLGDQFEQDSITYAEPKGTFELIVGHSHYEDGKFLKTGQVIAEFDAGARYGASEGSMYSAIRGRPFQWAGWKSTKIKSAKLHADSLYNKQKRLLASLATKSAWDKQLNYAVSQISTKKHAIDKAVASCKEIFIKENRL